MILEPTKCYQSSREGAIPRRIYGQPQDMDNGDTAGKPQRTSYHVDNETQ
jgi:hypothetical protein